MDKIWQLTLSINNLEAEPGKGVSVHFAHIVLIMYSLTSLI